MNKDKHRSSLLAKSRHLLVTGAVTATLLLVPEAAQASVTPPQVATPSVVAVPVANVATIVTTTTNAAKSQVTMARATVTVRSGDTLAKIAARSCGSQSFWRSIWAQNSQIRNPNLIYPGQRLNVSCTRTSTRASRSSTNVRAPASGNTSGVVNFALSQRGKPYRFGATGPGSYDCSGLVVAAYRSVGISLPHFTGSLLSRGTRVSRADLRPGDLVFTSSSHVGIYLGDNQMVAAPHRGANVRTQSVYAFYAGRRIL